MAREQAGKRRTIPRYRRHKASGLALAVVTLDDKDFYLGAHGTEETRVRYRLIAERLANGRARCARWPLGRDAAAMGDLETARTLVANAVTQRLGRAWSRPAEKGPLG